MTNKANPPTREIFEDANKIRIGVCATLASVGALRYEDEALSVDVGKIKAVMVALTGVVHIIMLALHRSGYDLEKTREAWSHIAGNVFKFLDESGEDPAEKSDNGENS